MSKQKNTAEEEFSDDDASEFEVSDDSESSTDYTSDISEEDSTESNSDDDDSESVSSHSSSSSSDTEEEIIDLTETLNDKDELPISNRTRSRSGSGINNENPSNYAPRKRVKITWDESDQMKRIRKGMKPLTILMNFSLDEDDNIYTFEVLDTDTEELEIITFKKNLSLNFLCSCEDDYYVCKHVAYILNVMCGMDQEEIYEFSVPEVNLDRDIKQTVISEKKDQIKKMWEMAEHNCDLLSKLSKRKEEEKENPDTKCMICLEPLYKEKTWKCFKCKNVIHNLCIIYHFEKNPRCPLCSFDITKYLNDEEITPNNNSNNNNDLDNLIEEPFN